MLMSLKLNTPYYGVVKEAEIPKFKHKWFGILQVEIDGMPLSLYMTGNIAQWILTGEKVKIIPLQKPRKGSNNEQILDFKSYSLWKYYDNNEIHVWPVYEKIVELVRVDPVLGKEVYKYKVKVREATYESDYEEIAELEQFHYASKKAIVALWRCENCGTIIPSNIKPVCPKCNTDKHVHIYEIKGSTPASRFLVLELADREPYEPKIVGYVRIDPPIPKMHRRLPDGSIVHNIRESIFPYEWFNPPFWPEKILREKYKLLKQEFGATVSRAKIWEEGRVTAIKTANTAGARIARVVIHPDYRSDGLGQLAVKQSLEWISERRIPEMRKKKEIVETIAMMARYNPFFEKVGFKYLWDTASGRPVLFYPLTDTAKKLINLFLENDEVAKTHKGRLCVPKYGTVDKLKGPIQLINATKSYENDLSVERLRPELRKVLEAFGVRYRLIQRLVLRDVNLSINPGELIVVVGASGAGKTTLLRLIYGAIYNLFENKFVLTSGEVKVPDNVKPAILLPGELEPKFEHETILEHIFYKTKDIDVAVEILNKAGLSDAVLYRAKFSELSTGQKERAIIASLLAEKPNLLLIDEFASHLDVLTAMRVARKVSELVRSAGITAIIVTHRREIIKSLAPDRIIYVGYGIVSTATKQQMDALLK